MEKSESIKEIASALCKFQGVVAKVKKTETNPFFKSKYADLSAILDVIREPLFECGLSFVQIPSSKYELTTLLMHISGEWISGTFEMKPVKDDPQGAGSVITYQRRYALGSILGLNIDIDDDANEASKPAKPSLPKLTADNDQFLKAKHAIETGVVTKEQAIEKLKKVFNLTPEIIKSL